MVVNRWEWLWDSAIFKGADKIANIDVELGLNPAQCFALCSLIMFA